MWYAASLFDHCCKALALCQTIAIPQSRALQTACVMSLPPRGPGVGRLHLTYNRTGWYCPPHDITVKNPVLCSLWSKLMGSCMHAGINCRCTSDRGMVQACHGRRPAPHRLAQLALTIQIAQSSVLSGHCLHMLKPHHNHTNVVGTALLVGSADNTSGRLLRCGVCIEQRLR